jgi:hypothetical protein
MDRMTEDRIAKFMKFVDSKNVSFRDGEMMRNQDLSIRAQRKIDRDVVGTFAWAAKRSVEIVRGNSQTTEEELAMIESIV